MSCLLLPPSPTCQAASNLVPCLVPSLREFETRVEGAYLTVTPHCVPHHKHCEHMLAAQAHRFDATSIPLSLSFSCDLFLVFGILRCVSTVAIWVSGPTYFTSWRVHSQGALSHSIVLTCVLLWVIDPCIIFSGCCSRLRLMSPLASHLNQQCCILCEGLFRMHVRQTSYQYQNPKGCVQV